MKIVIIVEGKTERAFAGPLRAFLGPRLAGKMPYLKFVPQDGRVPKEEKYRRLVVNWLREVDAVIALTDVYTGTSDSSDASDAKQKMSAWVGNDPRFYPHAAQHDFEAWLLPYWKTIQEMAHHNRNAPPGDPEKVNHQSPPSKRIQEIFEIGQCRDSYSKVRDARKILEKNDLLVAACACPELKAFLNTILSLCGGNSIT